MTIEADFWDYGHDIESMVIWIKINEGNGIKGSFVRRGKLPREKSVAPLVRLEEVSQAPARSAPAPDPAPAANVSLTLKHFQRRRETAIAASEDKRLYLRVGDEVNHLRHEEWGMGVAMEVMSSSVPGGTCLVRVRFQDGQLRCFNNDLDNQACCYYFGLRRYWNPSHGVDAIRTKLFGRG